MIHDFAHHQVVLEHLEIVCGGRRDRDRVAPVAEAPGAVFMPHAGAVGVADFQHVSGDGDAGVECEQFAAGPDFGHFVNAVVGRLVGGRGGVRDFADAPLDRGEGAGALWVGKCAARKRDSVHWISADARVGDRRFRGQKAGVDSVADAVEIGRASASADCGVGASGGVGPAGEHEGFHVRNFAWHAAGVVGVCTGRGPAGEVGWVECGELGGGVVHDVVEWSASAGDVAIDEEIAEFPDGVAVRDGHGSARRLLRQEPCRRIDDVVVIVEGVVDEVPAAVKGRAKRRIPIVGHVPKPAERVSCLRFKVPDEVLHAVPSGGFDKDVVVADGFLDSVVFVVERHVYILLHVRVRCGLVDVVADVVEVFAEVHAERSLPALGHLAVLHPVAHFVEVAALKIACFEEVAAVGEFERLIEPPEVAERCVGFTRIAHDAEVDPVAFGDRHAAERPHFPADLVGQSEVVKAFVSEEFVEEHVLPRARVFLPAFVGGSERCAFRKFEAEVPFAGAVIARVSTAQTDDGVVDNFFADDECALEILKAACFEVGKSGGVSKLLSTVVGEQSGEVRRASEPVIRRQCIERCWRECARAGDVSRHAVIDEKGEVFPWVVDRWNSRVQRSEIGRIDAVADECSVGLRGDYRGEDAVADEVASHGAVVRHRDGGPVRRQLKCRIRGQCLIGVREDLRVCQRQGTRDEVARCDDLVAEGHCANSLRVGHFR